MEEITELEGRIISAMERIGRSVQQFEGTGGVSPEDLEQARAAFEAAEERAVGARTRAESAEAELARVAQALEAEAAASEKLHERLDGLKSARDEQQQRIADLEAQLRDSEAQRKADRTELDDLIALVEPLVREASNA
ncbi:hypothetical protein [Tropicimonas sp.]|uniref:hypothetical protein n=1 Tax=Tropicimonas sp. TaxID=2067044 RepID=UPI003A84B1A4